MITILRLIKFIVLGSLFFLAIVSFAEEKEYTPVGFTDMKEKIEGVEFEPWSAPNYDQQKSALGYELGAFAIPAGMEGRVSFWLDIYTKYSTEMGLLHDSLYPHIVYEVVDFDEINKKTDLNERAKRKLKRKLVDTKKKAIKSKLLKLEKLQSSVGLKGEELRYWYLFSNVNDKNKFKDASRVGRLRFQLGQKDRFAKGIFYSGRYLKEMEEIFRGQNLPVELTRLPFVESSFNYKARSKVGASGIWQFMRYAARPFLKMNVAVDERNHPIKSTWAAAKQLRINYNMLNSWPLAVTGYNHGPSGVRRLVKKYKTRNISELIEKRRGRFGFASASFYASFLAALEAEKNAAKYFGSLTRQKPQKSSQLILSKAIDHKLLLNWFSGNQKQAKRFNPHLREHFWKGWVRLKRKNFVRIPVTNYDVAVKDLRALKRLPPLKSPLHYRIVKGETLGGIARRFHVSVSSLLNANNISNPRRIRAGQRLLIPRKF